MPYPGTPAFSDAPTVLSSGPGAAPPAMPYAPTVAASGPGSLPYGYPPSGSAASPYGSTVYGTPVQPYPDPSLGMPLVPPPPPPPLLPRIFGPDADALAARPVTRVQAMFLRNVALRYVVSKWFTALVGAVTALFAGLLLTIIMQSIWSNFVAKTLELERDKFTSALLNPNFLNFFALEHQVTLMLHYAGGTQTADLSYTLPVLGLLLAPALALILGGYIGASSDFHRVPRFSIARGALIGPFYAVILLILSQFSSNSVDGTTLNIGPGTATISPSVLQECLFGLLWGVLFGALGGWIQLTGRRFLSAALPAIQSARRTRLAGALAGAGVALGCGILIFLALELAFLTYEATSAAGAGLPGIPFIGPPQALNNTGSAIELVLALGPAAAIWFFSLGTGAPGSVSCAITSSTSSGGGCFSLIGASVSNTSTTFGLINADHTPTNTLFFLLALAPLVCYFAGGRVAARVAQARQTGDAFIAGAVLAIPLSLALGLMTLLVSIGTVVTASGENGGTSTLALGPTFGSTFLAVLIGGAIVGGIGGASAVATPHLGSLPRLLLLPFRPLGWLLAKLLDRLTRQPAGQPRSEGIKWLYDGVLAALILAVVVLILNPLSRSLVTSVPFGVIRGLNVWAATILVGLPLLYFIGALVTAFSTPPLAQSGAAAPLAAAPAAAAGTLPQGWLGSASGAFTPGMQAPGSQPFASGMIAPASELYPSGIIPPASQPFPPGTAGPASQPFPPGGPYASQPFAPAAPPGMQAPPSPSQPFPAAGPPGAAGPPQVTP